MATLCVNIEVSNLAKVITVYNRIRIYRSDTRDAQNEPINFVEVTNALTRIPIVSTSMYYTYIDTDLAATTDSYYRVTFSDSTGTTPESRPSPNIQAIPNPALDILSVDQLRNNFLFGIDLTDDDGNPIPDAALAFYIESAVRQAEELLDLPIIPRTITDERHDFFRQEYCKYVKLQADQYPVLEVSAVRLVLPSDVEVISFPVDWIRTQKFSGQIEILPSQGSISLATLGLTGAWLPLVYGWTDYIPEVFRIDYRAGFDPVPASIIEFIGMLAAFGPLNIAGDLVLGAGIAQQSIGIDAIQTSVSSTASATNAGYGARLTTYGRKIQQMRKDLRQYYKGIPLIAG